MKNLPEPIFGAREVLDSCAGSIRDAELSARLQLVVPTMEAAEEKYRCLAPESRLFEIAATTTVDGVVTATEMSTLYKGTFSKSGSRNRHFYDRLKLAAPNGICPLCGQRAVKTLDHYLPKAQHPSFAVTPLNLVPACSDCNKLKLDRVADSMADQTLHPYYDDVSDAAWLAAEVMEANIPAVIFSACPPVQWDAVKRQRLLAHFRTFGLGELYAVQASAEMVNIRYALSEAAQSSGADGVKAFLLLQARSRTKADANSWNAALYRALSESSWFCNIGFTLLG